MDERIQTFLFMLASTLKSGDHSFITYLPLLIIVFPFLQNMIEVNGICKYLSQLIQPKGQYFEYKIQSHDVPVVKNFTNVPMMRIQFSHKFLAVSHFINKTINKHNFRSITEIMSYNSEVFSPGMMKRMAVRNI